ncbi:TPA: hypothetical protein KDZ68_003359 [Vibrio parahaemolyticus]|nr:hypothetical protein [Vibrio parahaemolyticus]
MAFASFYDKLNIKIRYANSLEKLIVWRRRVSIGNSGLSFKQLNGRLIYHRYNKEKEATIDDDK